MSDAAVETTRAADKVEEPSTTTTTTTTNESKDTISTVDSTAEKLDSAQKTQQQQPKQEASNKVDSSSSSSKESKEINNNDNNEKTTTSYAEEASSKPSKTIESTTSNKVDGAKVDRSLLASEESEAAESKCAPKENKSTELNVVSEDGKATGSTNGQAQDKQRRTNNSQIANGDSDKAANGTSDKSETQKERKGILSDASALPPSEDPAEIKKQVELHFSLHPNR